jgi:outer membrane protein OmpA-like peptidoglycan-associated protein
MYAADQFREVFKDNFKAAQLYRKAFETYPTSEAAQSEYMAVRLQGTTTSNEEAFSFLEEASNTLHSDSFVELALAFEYLSPDLGQAKKYFRRAIDDAPTSLEHVADTIMYARFYLERVEFRLDDARDVYRDLLRFDTNRAEVLNSMYMNRILAQDYAGAQRALVELIDYEEHDSLNSVANELSLGRERAYLRQSMDAQADAESFRERNPFLTYWEDAFGISLAVAIEFSHDSDVLTGNTKEQLAIVASRLRRPGANNYLLAIEGHAEPSEQDTSLSRRRAEAVAAYLSQTLHVERENIQISWPGTKPPVVPIAISPTIRSNRIVEIRPVGNLTEPRISVTPALVSDHQIAIAPSGRQIAIGQNPVQLWDVERQIKLRDFDLGYAPAFSPDGRYLAIVSKSTVRILDVFTGTSIALFRELGTIGRIAWEPRGHRLIYASANRLIMVDAVRRIRIRSLILKRAINTRDYVWTKGGQIVTAQPRDDKVRVWDAEDFHLIKELSGVNWVHALGQTHDSSYVVAADNESTLTVWDTTNWTARQMRLNVAPDDIIAHPNQPIVLLNNWSGKFENRAVAIDVQRMQITAFREAGEQRVRYQYSPDGQHVYGAKANGVEIYDGATLESSGAFEQNSFPALGAVSSSKAGKLITYDISKIHSWDVRTGRETHNWSLGARTVINDPDDEEVHFIILY